eukprot:Seg1086.4 transcript_id=Seg1086.4/GoldUCD/mRNA.D3Y31 product="hypothetical protein" protein_id=Seg1086.4/GoldUCD/D3Y31
MMDTFKQFSLLLLALNYSGWCVLSAGSTAEQSSFVTSSTFSSHGRSSTSSNLPNIEIKTTSNENHFLQATRMTTTFSQTEKLASHRPVFGTIESHVGSIRPSISVKGESMHITELHHTLKGDDNDLVMMSSVNSESSYFIPLSSKQTSNHKGVASKTLQNSIEISASKPKLSLQSSPTQRINSFQEILPTESCHSTEYPNITKITSTCQPLFGKSAVEERMTSQVTWLQSSRVIINQFNVTTTTTPQQTSFLFATLFGVFGTLLVLGIAGMIAKSIHKKNKNRVKAFTRTEFVNA